MSSRADGYAIAVVSSWWRGEYGGPVYQAYYAYLAMSSEEQWEEWLTEADSAQALAPEGYDDDAAMALVRALHERASQTFSDYSVTTASPELYQDSTGLTDCRISSKHNGTVAAWVVLSHFGPIATVQDCVDAVLLHRIVTLLEALKLKVIDYDYLRRRIYNGECKGLVGGTLANRYFGLEVIFNSEVLD